MVGLILIDRQGYLTPARYFFVIGVQRKRAGMKFVVLRSPFKSSNDIGIKGFQSLKVDKRIQRFVAGVVNASIDSGTIQSPVDVARCSSFKKISKCEGEYLDLNREVA